MQVVILADRIGEQFSVLTQRMPLPLFPVVGKPLLVHALESVVSAGLHEVLVVLSGQTETVKESLGEGQRWGLRIHYASSQGAENFSQLAPRLNLDPQQAYLVLRGDVLQSSVLDEFLLASQDQQQSSVCGRVGEHIAYCLLRPGSELSAADCLGQSGKKESDEQAAMIQLENAAYNGISDFVAYHRANIDALNGEIPGLIIPGRETALGLYCGPRAKVSPRSLKQGKAYVGAESRVDAQSEFLNTVVISDHVVTDRHVTLDHCVILPGTYIGEWVEVKNAIVCGNDLIRVDNGAVTHVTDSFLLAELETETLNKSLANLLHRVFGLGLLLLSLPLWLVAALFTYGRGKKPALQRCTLQGNRLELNEFGMQQRRAFTAWEWNLSTPVLRHLPKLLAVISGDIRLIGVTPLSPEQAANRQEDWEKVRDQAPIGLFGPSQLQLPSNAPLEEKLLSDAFYSKQRSTGKDLSYLWEAGKTLFKRRAWLV